MKFALVSLIALGIGIFVGRMSIPQQGVDAHWEKLREYREWTENPTGGELHDGTGFVVYDQPIDPIPSLHFLVSKGELRKADLIFPNVPKSKAITMRWIEFCQAHKEEIVDGYANSEPPELKTSGTMPFSCTVFYRPENQDVIHEMIATVEKGANQSELSIPLAPASLTP